MNFYQINSCIRFKVSNPLFISVQKKNETLHQWAINRFCLSKASRRFVKVYKYCNKVTGYIIIYTSICWVTNFLIRNLASKFWQLWDTQSLKENLIRMTTKQMTKIFLGFHFLELRVPWKVPNPPCCNTIPPRGHSASPEGPACPGGRGRDSTWPLGFWRRPQRLQWKWRQVCLEI